MSAKSNIDTDNNASSETMPSSAPATQVPPFDSALADLASTEPATSTLASNVAVAPPVLNSTIASTSTTPHPTSSPLIGDMFMMPHFDLWSPDAFQLAHVDGWQDIGQPESTSGGANTVYFLTGTILSEPESHANTTSLASLVDPGEWTSTLLPLDPAPTTPAWSPSLPTLPLTTHALSTVARSRLLPLLAPRMRPALMSTGILASLASANEMMGSMHAPRRPGLNVRWMWGQSGTVPSEVNPLDTLHHHLELPSVPRSFSPISRGFRPGRVGSTSAASIAAQAMNLPSTSTEAVPSVGNSANAANLDAGAGEGAGKSPPRTRKRSRETSNASETSAEAADEATTAKRRRPSPVQAAPPRAQRGQPAQNDVTVSPEPTLERITYAKAIRKVLTGQDLRVGTIFEKLERFMPLLMSADLDALRSTTRHTLSINREFVSRKVAEGGSVWCYNKSEPNPGSKRDRSRKKPTRNRVKKGQSSREGLVLATDSGSSPSKMSEGQAEEQGSQAESASTSEEGKGSEEKEDKNEEGSEGREENEEEEQEEEQEEGVGPPWSGCCIIR